MTLVSKIGHSHDNHHIFDTVGGTVLIGLRLLILLVFLFGIAKTFGEVRHGLKEFLLRLGLWGAIYIGGMPVVVVAAN